MAYREIKFLPDPILRRKAHKVEKIDRDTRKLIDDMVETMRVAPGVGLAAPQVGISSRIVVVEFGSEEDETKPKKLYTLINPELTFIGEEKETAVEGCLSVPGVVGEVERFLKVQVKALNRNGTPISIKASGWLARIFQHELDHLEGIVFPDRSIRVWKPVKDEKEIDV
jgi:peptide deformylase